MYRGIDVSRWQGTIDWGKVKKAGIQFAIIRAGHGQNNIDEQFKRNISECNRLDIPCGVYWFSYALNPEMARQEARYCLEAVKPYTVEYPICFDFEYDSVNYAKKKGVTITKELATAIADAFLNEVEKAGYYAMNYTNKDYLTRMFDMSKLKKYDLWYAYWSSKCDRDDAGIWQYTSDGKVDGISGRVDMNIAYKDYPAIIREKGLNRLNKDELSSRVDPRREIHMEVDALKKGDKGALVKKVQEMLLALGYALPKYGADGDFGGETELAVNAFKKAVNLPQDGIVDINTLLAMSEALVNKEKARTKDFQNRLQVAKIYAKKIAEEA